MRITYLLDRPEVGGGPKVVFQHATLLAKRGHEVTVAAHGVEPAWSGRSTGYRDLSAGDSLPANQDLTIATWWTTIAPAVASDAKAVAHFCQGFEADLAHLAGQASAIRGAYELPLPALVVAPHLGERLAREFARESRLAPPALDRGNLRRPRFAPRRCPWIAILGVFEAEVKGIRTGIEAFDRLRAQGACPRLLRVSALPWSEEEKSLVVADRFLEAVSPASAQAALATCDLLIFPSLPIEGFGLPLLEAMQLGVPAVASRTPGTEFMTAGGRGALLVPAGDAEAFAAAAAELLGAPSRWRALRQAGRAAARRFAPVRVAGEIEAAVRWAAGAGARSQASV